MADRSGCCFKREVYKRQDAEEPRIPPREETCLPQGRGDDVTVWRVDAPPHIHTRHLVRPMLPFKVRGVTTHHPSCCLKLVGAATGHSLYVVLTPSRVLNSGADREGALIQHVANAFERRSIIDSRCTVYCTRIHARALSGVHLAPVSPELAKPLQRCNHWASLCKPGRAPAPLGSASGDSLARCNCPHWATCRTCSMQQQQVLSACMYTRRGYAAQEAPESSTSVSCDVLIGCVTPATARVTRRNVTARRGAPPPHERAVACWAVGHL